jgi:hypothetical protein
VSENLPVLAEPRPIERAPVVSLPLVRVLRRPKPVALRLGRRKKSDIAASRSFLVDVHLLKDR